MRHLSLYYFHFAGIFRSTPPSRPNNIRGGKCPSISRYVRPSVHLSIKSLSDFNDVHITKEIASNVSCMLHRNGPVDYKICGVMQQCIYGTKICDIYDIYDLQKCLTQTWVDFEQNVIKAAIDQWRDSLRSCMRAVADTLNTSVCQLLSDRSTATDSLGDI